MELEQKIFIFQNELNNLIENSNLTISIVYFIFKDFFKEIESLYTKNLQLTAQRYSDTKEDYELIKNNPNIKVEVVKHD